MTALIQSSRGPARARGPAAEQQTWVVDDADIAAGEAEVVSAVRGEVLRVLAEGGKDCPRLPVVAIEVARLAADPLASAQDVSRVLHRDPMLTGHVLNSANSALAWRGERRLVGIESAVLRLGLHTVRDIVVASALGHALVHGPQIQIVEQLWRQSLGTAVACDLISRTIGLKAEQGYLLGLLHGVGKPVTIHAVHRLMKGPLGQRVSISEAMEWALDGVSNEVTGLLLRRWSFPAPLVDRVMLALGDDQVEPLPRVTALLRLGIWLCEQAENLPISDEDARTLAQMPGAEVICLEHPAALRIVRAYPEALDSVLSPLRREKCTRAAADPPPRAKAAIPSAPDADEVFEGKSTPRWLAVLLASLKRYLGVGGA
jgi:HD-like signal output (HDOD) protein